MTVVILSGSIVLLCMLLGFSIYFNIKLGKLILELQDSIEDSLDVLDQRYHSMSQVLEKPLFFDSLEVRQVIQDIRTSQNAILYVAQRLTDAFETEIEIDPLPDFETTKIIN